jgi:hypothetical protein
MMTEGDRYLCVIEDLPCPIIFDWHLGNIHITFLFN